MDLIEDTKLMTVACFYRVGSLALRVRLLCGFGSLDYVSMVHRLLFVAMAPQFVSGLNCKSRKLNVLSCKSLIEAQVFHPYTTIFFFFLPLLAI